MPQSQSDANWPFASFGLKCFLTVIFRPLLPFLALLTSLLHLKYILYKNKTKKWVVYKRYVQPKSSFNLEERCATKSERCKLAICNGPVLPFKSLLATGLSSSWTFAPSVSIKKYFPDLTVLTKKCKVSFLFCPSYFLLDSSLKALPSRQYETR